MLDTSATLNIFGAVNFMDRYCTIYEFLYVYNVHQALFAMNSEDISCQKMVEIPFFLETYLFHQKMKWWKLKSTIVWPDICHKIMSSTVLNNFVETKNEERKKYGNKIKQRAIKP